MGNFFKLIKQEEDTANSYRNFVNCRKADNYSVRTHKDGDNLALKDTG